MCQCRWVTTLTKMALRTTNEPYTISTSGEGPEDHVVHWERYFGPMDNQSRETYANDAFSYRTHNLPKAYEGKNLFLQATINFLVTEPNSFYTSVLMPWQYTDEVCKLRKLRGG